MAEPVDENDVQPMILAHVSDADLLRHAAQEAHDTGEGCSPEVAVELERRGLVTYEDDDENEESNGTLTAKGRAALAGGTPSPGGPSHG